MFLFWTRSRPLPGLKQWVHWATNPGITSHGHVMPILEKRAYLRYCVIYLHFYNCNSYLNIGISMELASDPGLSACCAARNRGPPEEILWTKETIVKKNIYRMSIFIWFHATPPAWQADAAPWLSPDATVSSPRIPHTAQLCPQSRLVPVIVWEYGDARLHLHGCFLIKEMGAGVLLICT
jgi:hypothetical protein